MTNAIPEITNSPVAINGLDVVKKVNDFYATSFNHILWLLGVLIALLGIVVPVVYYFLQKRQLTLSEKIIIEGQKRDFEELEKKLKQESAQFQEAQRELAKKEFEQLESKINRRISFALGGLYMLQANFERERKSFRTAFESYIDGIEKFAEGLHLKAVQQNLRLATDKTLPELNKNHFRDEALAKKAATVIESVQKIEAKGLLDVDIRNFQKALANAQEREPK